MTLNRRRFLASLPMLAGVGRVYFDMGAAWRKHESIWMPGEANMSIDLDRWYMDQNVHLPPFYEQAIQEIVDRIDREGMRIYAQALR